MSIILPETGLMIKLNKEDFTAKIISSEKSIQNIIIPKAVFVNSNEYKITAIGQESFKCNNRIKSIAFPKDSEVEFICQDSFSHSSIESISIPAKVKQIGDFAFYCCFNLRIVEFTEDSQLISIGNEVFHNTKITNIKIPKHVQKIGQGSFSECKSLTNIEFAENSELNIISSKLFSHTSFKSITIPSKVQKICDNAFYCCRNLETINFCENSELKTIEYEAFLLSLIVNLSIPSNVKELKEGWCALTLKLTNVILSPENKFFSYLDEEKKIIIGKSNQSNDDFDTLVFAARDIKQVKVPSTIKHIDPYCFNFCEHLTKIFIPENSELLTVGKAAFDKTCIT